jgi:hypothetical protein
LAAIKLIREWWGRLAGHFWSQWMVTSLYHIIIKLWDAADKKKFRVDVVSVACLFFHDAYIHGHDTPATPGLELTRTFLVAHACFPCNSDTLSLELAYHTRPPFLNILKPFSLQLMYCFSEKHASFFCISCILSREIKYPFLGLLLSYLRAQKPFPWQSIFHESYEPFPDLAFPYNSAQFPSDSGILSLEFWHPGILSMELMDNFHLTVTSNYSREFMHPFL